MAATRVFALSAHASYACRHSGACCTAGWTIPVEPHARQLLRMEWLIPNRDGSCPEYDHDHRRCRVHTRHGAVMLPRSCHHFPRRALVDDRGIFVALSHFCPTAASLLLESSAPLLVVNDAVAFPAARGYDGLTATGEWPPLLRPDALFDLDSFSEWERHLVSSIGNSTDDVGRVLRRVAVDVERLRTWRVADGPLLERTQAVIAGNVDGPHDCDSNGICRRYAPYAQPWTAYEQLGRFVPEGLSRPVLTRDVIDADRALVAPVWETHAPLINRYVAAKAFASWTAYQWRDIRAQVAELHLSASILRVECARSAQQLQRPLDPQALHEAVRASDLLLMHLVDRDPLVEWLRKAECEA